MEKKDSRVAEAFRGALTAMFSAGAPRTLVVTSALPSEGKTTSVCGLAISLAEIGHRTLLIDGDMHRPQLHWIFGVRNDRGFSDVLRDEGTIKEFSAVVKNTAVAHLYLVPNRVCTENPLHFLSSRRLPQLLAHFREEFDYVLVDAPACLEFVDARNIARFTEGAVLVLRAHRTGRNAAESAVRLLQSDRVRLTGIILNGL